ncbi:MAG: AAA family ATPase [Isosphaeraceae bacterium]
MDRPAALLDGDSGKYAESGADELLLPSRALALEALRTAVVSRRGPVLLTGEAGTGKSWLRTRLIWQLDHDWRAIAVDLSPALTPEGFYRLVLRELYHPATCSDTAAARVALEDRLLDAEDDGERWLLVVEEAHTASDLVLEELRVLTNRVGQAGALGSMVLVGQPNLARRLGQRPINSLAQRLTARIHLRPLTLQELELLVNAAAPGEPISRPVLERLHRDLRGNPRLCLRSLGREGSLAIEASRASTLRLKNASAERSAPEQGAETERPPLDLTSAVPARPPLEVSDGMIEVGWDSESLERGDSNENPAGTGSVGYMESPPAAALGERLPEVRQRQGSVLPSVEVIEDRYTAIQAWNEWSRNQEHLTTRPTSKAPGLEDEIEPLESLDSEDRGSLNHGELPSETSLGEVRAESQHGFAPYSQLFSRLREPRDQA